MNEVWLAHERHGYNYVFSSREIAEVWFRGELEDNFVELDDPEIDYTNTEDLLSCYYAGELVAEVEKVILDKVE